MEFTSSKMSARQMIAKIKEAREEEDALENRLCGCLMTEFDSVKKQLHVKRAEIAEMERLFQDEYFFVPGTRVYIPRKDLEIRLTSAGHIEVKYIKNPNVGWSKWESAYVSMFGALAVQFLAWYYGLEIGEAKSK